MPWLRSSMNKVQTNVLCCCFKIHRTCYTIVCIVPWCTALATYKTSTASIQSIGFALTGLLISFACDLWVSNVRFTGTFIPPLSGTFKRHKICMGFFWELIFWSWDFLSFLEALGIFLGLDFWLYSIISVT